MKKTIGFFVLFALVIGILLLQTATNTSKSLYHRPGLEDIPEEILDWIELSKEIPMVQEREYQGQRYLLITEGAKPTGGYAIEVTNVTQEEESLIIHVQSKEPGPEDLVTQAITYPFDLIILEDKDLPLIIKDVEDEYRHFMNLWGLDVIDSPIVAASDWIKIFCPKPGEEISGVIDLRGIASVFEGTVSYDLIASTGEVIYHSFTSAAFLDWGYFEEEIEVPKELENTDFYLELYSISMKDGSLMFKVTIPLSSNL